jgi:virginiamycin B lyase
MRPEGGNSLMRSMTRRLDLEALRAVDRRRGVWRLALAGVALGLSLAFAAPATAVPCSVDVDVSRDTDRLPSACAHFPISGGQAVGPIAAGGDGRVWLLTDAGGPALMRVDSSGGMQRVGLPNGQMPTAITGGPDGNIWYVRPGAIGVVGPNGPVGEVPLPGVSPSGIVTGPDGALWFPAGSRLGRTTTGGAVSYVALNGAGVSQTHGITVGSDRALWIAAGPLLARATVGGSVSTLRAAGGRQADGGIASASDGALWYSSSSGALGRVAQSGAVSAFALPAGATDVVRGPGQSTLWAAVGGFVARVSSDQFASGRPPGVSCRGQNPAACLSRLPAVPLGQAGLLNARGATANLAVGPDGNVWYSEGGLLGRVLPFRGALPCYQRVTRNTAFGCGRTQSRIGQVTQGGQAYLRTSCPRLTFRFCRGALTLRTLSGRRIASARYLLGSYDNPKVRVVLPRSTVAALRRHSIRVRAVYDSTDAGGIRRVNRGTWTLRFG